MDELFKPDNPKKELLIAVKVLPLGLSPALKLLDPDNENPTWCSTSDISAIWVSGAINIFRRIVSTHTLFYQSNSAFCLPLYSESKKLIV